MFRGRMIRNQSALGLLGGGGGLIRLLHSLLHMLTSITQYTNIFSISTPILMILGRALYKHS